MSGIWEYRFLIPSMASSVSGRLRLENVGGVLENTHIHMHTKTYELE